MTRCFSYRLHRKSGDLFVLSTRGVRVPRGGFIALGGSVIKTICEAAREVPKGRPRVEETGRTNQLSLSITLKFCLGPRSPGDYRLCPKPDKYSFSIPDIERSGNG